MKRIFAMALTLILTLTALSGCAVSQDPTGEPLSMEMTIAQTMPSCVPFEYREEKAYCLYAFDAEGALCRVFWNDFSGLQEGDVITVDYHAVREIKETQAGSGWSPRYELTAVDVRRRHYPGETVNHIWIQSGSDTIRPVGCMTWSSEEYADGTSTETTVDKYDVVDFVNGKTPFSPENIPQLTLCGSVSCTLQINGSVENVYLLSQTGDGYTKSGTTLDDLSTLAPGRYYVVLEVLLGANCVYEPTLISSRYEDVFCLIVDEAIGVVPYDEMLRLEVADGKLIFQRIATTPCIVYARAPISDMWQVFEDRHDVLTAIFQAMNGKPAIMDTPECIFQHYIYMFDNEREDVPWHYSIAISDCGAVVIKNNDALICSIKLTTEEIQSILSMLA